MPSWPKHEIQLVFLETDELPCLDLLRYVQFALTMLSHLIQLLDLHADWSQTTLQWQTRHAHCSLVLGKAFPTISYYHNVLYTYNICCYAQLAKTREPTSISKNR
jgi:hypothetical protein